MVNSNVIESILREVLFRIATELTGGVHTKWATDQKWHLYQNPITYAPSTGLFEVNSMHLVVFSEQLIDGESIGLKEVNAAMKAILGEGFDYRHNRKQTTAVIENEFLKGKFDGKAQIRVYQYILNTKDFLDPEAALTLKRKNGEAVTSFCCPHCNTRLSVDISPDQSKPTFHTIKLT